MSMYYLNPATGKYELQGAPHVDAYSKEQTDALIAANAGAKMELLWENASPNSIFNPQTVSLALSGYDGVQIAYQYYPKETTVSAQHSIRRVFNLIGEKGIMVVSADKIHDRAFTVSTNGIAFEACRRFNSYATEGSDNNLVIPIKIYGVKGVIKNV